MNKPNAILVRPMSLEDYGFIRDTAAQERNFTIPPLYVLWLLSKIKGDICLVAEDVVGGRLAYLLAVPVSEPPNSLFVWQLAVRDHASSSDAIRSLLLKLHQISTSIGISSIFFSSIPGSAAHRAISKHIKDIVSKEPVQTSLLEEMIAPGEVEFRIDLE